MFENSKTSRKGEPTNINLVISVMDSLNPISSSGIAAKNAPQDSKSQAGNVASGDRDAARSKPDVHVDLSSQLSAAESEAIMREAKVKEMREAIEEGRFPLDAKKIAENFAELEKLL